MNEQVDISVIMPVYNTPGYILQRAVRSVTDQVGLDVRYELIVVDDGSTAAATLEVLRKLKMYEGVRVLRIGKNSGQSTARNVGVLAARGGLLAFLDADDIMFSTSLALHYHHIEQGYDFVFSQFALMDHVDGKARIG
jgi:glycosyltransferase involved in cell wall biosynthesis